MYRELSDDGIMRELNHLNMVIRRQARAHEEVGAPLVLAILAGHEEAMAEGFAPHRLTQVELANVLGIRPQSLGPILACLEEGGDIERDPSPQDRRALVVSLTEKGRRCAEDSRRQQKAFAEEVFAVLTKEERRQLSRIVQKLNEALG